ncbi:DUF1350 family protein [Brunnivagina elsteri]|uniref:DUF1350 domain-containing protein n=1 Tax=Brunnivagina elsteri CCALA 953 TaxID=987040 RepID=A0A2A2T9I9_9CYAN|nr:DUF1350 family protein [Calothrix elsteri]PAX45660.1 hypothetical protein CK510_30655 [Calothrix elsteri CCALA 953]
MEWKEISGNWVLIPPKPSGIIHFLGGAFVATAPQITYRLLLEALAEEGYIVIATPFVNTFDHNAIAKQVLLNFERALVRLEERGILGNGYFPIYGIGHSMGCKLHLLIGSNFSVERAGNIFMSFNNFAASEAVPLIEQFNTAITNNPLANRIFANKIFANNKISPNHSFAVDFTPSPPQTNDLIREYYNVRRNLLVKFTNDNIDQSVGLSDILAERFAEMVALQILPGNHITPLGQEMKWQAGQDFNPFDAFGQWFKQEVYRDLNQLKRTILLWLNPLSSR